MFTWFSCIIIILLLSLGFIISRIQKLWSLYLQNPPFIRSLTFSNPRVASNGPALTSESSVRSILSSNHKRRKNIGMHDFLSFASASRTHASWNERKQTTTISCSLGSLPPSLRYRDYRSLINSSLIVVLD
jgi:hypothetical protein